MSESRAKAEALANLTGECCGTCRFGNEDPTAPPGQILCRRYPPTMMLASFLTQPVAEKRSIQDIGKGQQVIGTMSVTQGVQGHFPMMDARAGWCGEWKPKPEDLQ